MPLEGDISVCMYCAGVSAFDSNLRLEKIDPEQIRDEDPEVYELIMNARREIRSKHLPKIHNN